MLTQVTCENYVLLSGRSLECRYNKTLSCGKKKSLGRKWKQKVIHTERAAEPNTEPCSSTEPSNIKVQKQQICKKHHNQHNQIGNGTPQSIVALEIEAPHISSYLIIRNNNKQRTDVSPPGSPSPAAQPPSPSPFASPPLLFQLQV